MVSGGGGEAIYYTALSQLINSDIDAVRVTSLKVYDSTHWKQLSFIYFKWDSFTTPTCTCNNYWPTLQQIICLPPALRYSSKFSTFDILPLSLKVGLWVFSHDAFKCNTKQACYQSRNGTPVMSVLIFVCKKLRTWPACCTHAHEKWDPRCRYMPGLKIYRPVLVGRHTISNPYMFMIVTDHWRINK